MIKVNSDSILKWTGERLVTSVEDETATEHLHRYKIAMAYCKNKAVLDIACGEGYGSLFLASLASSVVGVDIDPISVDFAKKKYKKNNLEFKVGSCSAIPIESNSIDVVVSFETIEHHNEHEQMMTEIKRVLKPDGLLIISSPDKTYYSDKRNFNNAFHVKELTEDQFKNLLDKNFVNSILSNQRVVYGSLIVPKTNMGAEMHLYKGNYSLMSNFQLEPLYNFALASDVDLPIVGPSFFDGHQILKERIDQIYNSASFRLGYLLLKPFRMVRSFLGSKK
ncbi:MAG: class I SAM-dependent methyltransferase [Bacteroidia bacterium]